MNNSFNINSNRIIGFDVLRSLAILIVIYNHGQIILNQVIATPYFEIVDGVDLFFVLSGFLIGNIILKTFNRDYIRTLTLLGFWIRRWFRTIPNYLLAILSSLIVAYLFTNTIGEFNWKYLFFIQNFNMKHPSFLPQAWSLSVEECFYFAFPLILSFIINLTKFSFNKKYLITVFLFLIIPLAFRAKDAFLYNSVINNEILDIYFRKKTLLRLDSIGYGLLGAYLKLKLKNQWKTKRYFFIVLSVVIYICNHFYLNNTNLNNCVFRFSLDSLSILFILPFFNFIKIHNELLKKIIVLISTISYSMYLFHFDVILWPILECFNLSSIFTNIIAYTCYWLITILISYLIYKVYENKMTKIRDHNYFKKFY